KRKVFFYERGPWPTISFILASALALFTGINEGMTFIDRIRGPLFNFRFNNSECGAKGDILKPDHTYFLIHGEVFNEGKVPLRIQRFSLDVHYDGKWFPATVVNM